MILFLNKRDLFEEKIPKVPLQVCFPDYTGHTEVEPALTFIRNKFLQENLVTNKAIYTHITTATDTENIRNVFSAVRDGIINRALEHAG